ncbi:MAG: DUF1330 domain-containing protein [Leptolyngbya sp. SIO1D8]|nr:DUF1330 domain-containing protein [Leptolyngbya sp. SIO1D8]
MSVNHQFDASVEQLCAWYGDGQNGSAPSADQWRQILERPANESITLINFFKYRQIAEYPQGSPKDREPISGQDAFKSYSSVSIPTMERVGGKFLLVGPFEGMFLGEDEDWDLIAIGTYPNLESFMALYTNPDYRAASRHRTAACDRQKVIVCSG